MFIKYLIAPLTIGFFALAPSSTNYNLKSFDLGNGGGTSSSGSYNLNSITNGQSGDTSSSNYSAKNGLLPQQNSNVPAAPTFTNPDNSYNRLKLVINTSNNATDTKYAIAISSDDFVTTKYVKNDYSIASSLDLTDYLTYSSWGGASGFWVSGLDPSTTYKVKVKAMQGKFSESAYGPSSQSITDQPSITFSVTTTLSVVPPFSLTFSSLAPNTVFSPSADPLIGLTTNALYGGRVFISDNNSGLKSNESSYTINSTTSNLASAATGFGAQVISTSQTTGGPLLADSPYDGNSDNVGFISNVPQSILSTTGPLNGGSATVRLKAKTDNNVPAATDYSDIVTFVAAMSF